MKRKISIFLSLVMLLTVCLSVTSCETEAVTGYTQVRDHLIETVGEKNVASLDGTASGLTSVSLSTGEVEDGNDAILLVAYAMASSYVLQVTLTVTDDSGEAELVYELLESTTAAVVSTGYATLDGTSYTGNDLIVFDTVDHISVAGEISNRQNATAMTNGMLLALDTYLSENDLSVDDLGFTALSEKYRAAVTEVETEEDLGGAFSGARWLYAGRMTLLGMGMVFAVLALLWLLLIVFKNILAKDPEKKAAKAKETEAAPAEVASAPAPAATAEMTDGELVAAITAAVAAMIESDPALSAQFAGGFRVVSFKKKSGKTAWNR